MSRWRIVVVVLLLLLPFGGLAALGSYYLWTLHWGFWAWWPMAGCMALGYLLGWYWQRQQRLLRPPDFATPSYWTERDAGAWKLVEARAQAGGTLPPEKFTDLGFYVTTAEEMAVELASFYHPSAADPVDRLTIPEILAAVEFAAHDLSVLVDQYLPGGHLLTIRDFRLARRAIDWYQAGNTLYWAVAALFSPVTTGLRYAASTAGLSRPLEMLQNNLLLWFYTAYVHRVGTYLIDLNGGRLRVGAHRYRELLGEQLPRPAGESADGEAADGVRQVTVTLLGQVKAGKSSLVNALLGAQRARTDVLPATAGVERYELQPPGIPTRLVLLDTVGYGHAGPGPDQVQVTRESAQQSDLLLLVLHARNPARQADLLMLRALRDWFAAHPDLKKPPLVAVLSHVDLLSPALEWQPPYDWRRPKRAKEQNMAEAVVAVREQLGDFVEDIEPVCTVPGKAFGIDEGLLPAVARHLDEAHGVALLRCLKAEADAGKVRKVFHQLLAIAAGAAHIVQESRQPPPTGGQGGRTVP